MNSTTKPIPVASLADNWSAFNGHAVLPWDLSLHRNYSHHRMRPASTKKCERQPAFSQTDGVSVGWPRRSIVTSQRGFASWTTRSSTVLPQPHGHRRPTHQFSPSSCARTRFLRGSRAGNPSPSTTRMRLAGASRSQSRRMSLRIFLLTIYPQWAVEAPAFRAAALSHPGQEWNG